VLLTRKRIAWETYLDMPIGLTLRQEPGTGTPVISQLQRKSCNLPHSCCFWRR
jgi:hypothetical protein